MRRFRNHSRARDRVRRCVIPTTIIGAAIIGIASLGGAFAAHADPALATLDLDEAADLAVQQQPLLISLDAQARAAREASVASAQLPDPQLFGGVRDLPVDTREAYSLSNDSDTQLVVGVSQEFPRAEKRRLRAAQREREADRLTDEWRLAVLAIRRDTKLSWLDCWRADAARQIAIDTLNAADLQAQAVAIGVRSGTATQSDYIAALLNVERMRDGVAQRDQAADAARFKLERWIAHAAHRSLPTQPPKFSPVPATATLLERLPSHPELAVLRQRISESQTDVDLAEAKRLPDWRVEFGYGYRRDYSDMVMLQVGMDLPVFRGNRQDRDIASALAMSESAAAELADGERRLQSRALAASRNVDRISERLTAYDRDIEPKTNLGIDAATTAWRSGNGTLGQVLEARRVRFDVLLARLDLQFDAAKARIELDYLMGDE